MAAGTLIASKVDVSLDLARRLREMGSPLLAAFWDYDLDVERWTLRLVPTTASKERDLLRDAVDLLVEDPFRSAFSLAEPIVDSHQIDRARALGAHARLDRHIGRRFDTTFTGGQYFESAVPIYFAPELMTHLSPA